MLESLLFIYIKIFVKKSHFTSAKGVADGMFKDGYFYKADGKTRFVPLGMLTNYFAGNEIFLTPSRQTTHGENILEFHQLTKNDWRKFFAHLQMEGHTAMRLYPRGINIDNAWEGLDCGGQVNEGLLSLILDYINMAGSYGIRTQLILFTQPEASVYCSVKTQMLFGARFRDQRERDAAPKFVKRFCADKPETVSYAKFFMDDDVRCCCTRFLELLLPRIADNPNIFALELVNELGWCGPYAECPNAFFWKGEQSILDWAQEMVETIHRNAPQVPVCISGAGAGILGQDILCRSQRIRPDFYSIHLYPQMCGHLDGVTDFATVAEFSLKYAQANGNAMLGEWECTDYMGQLSEWDRQLCRRDIIWLSLLSGAPGILGRITSRGFGEYCSVQQVQKQLQGRNCIRKKPALGIDIRPLHARLLLLAQQKNQECAFRSNEWCPDGGRQNDGHCFCHQSKDALFAQALRLAVDLQEEGLDYDLTLTPEKYKANRPEQVRGASKLEAPKGYRMRQMLCSDGKTIIIYLRNYERKPVWQRLGQELYAVRDRAPKPFALRVADGWQPLVFDLDLKRWVDDFSIFHGTITSHDFVVLLFREENE